MNSIYLVLLHSPMVDKKGLEVTTAVTNMDIHDISRSCRTYGIKGYYIVNPEPEQEKLVGAILGHWKQEVSKVYHPDRAEALGTVEFKRSFEEVYNEVMRREGEESLKNEGVLNNHSECLPLVAMPDARDLSNHFSPSKTLSYNQLRNLIEQQSEPLLNRPLILVFGTGWGIAPRFFPKVDLLLKPLRKEKNNAKTQSTQNKSASAHLFTKDYNHLSVRSAVAIILDRLFGERE